MKFLHTYPEPLPWKWDLKPIIAYFNDLGWFPLYSDLRCTFTFYTTSVRLRPYYWHFRIKCFYIVYSYFLSVSITGQGVIASLGLRHCFGMGLEYWILGFCTSIEAYLYIALFLAHRRQQYCLCPRVSSIEP